MKTFLKSAQNQSLSYEICSRSFHENRPFFTNCFSAKLASKIPTKSAVFSMNLSLKIPQNLTFFSATYQKPWFQERKFGNLYQPECPVEPKKWDTRLVDEFVETYNQATNQHVDCRFFQYFLLILKGRIKATSSWYYQVKNWSSSTSRSKLMGKECHSFLGQYTRLDPVKTDHFLDFISRPCFLQDVAYR